MAHNSHHDLPFPLGSTYFDGGTVDTGQQSTNWEGREFTIPDYDPNNPAKLRSTHDKTVRIVRNVSTIALAAKRVVAFQATVGVNGKRVDGYCLTTGDGPVAIVDEFLSSNGCPVNDLCYVVVRGPAVATISSADMGADVAVNERIIASTAAASTSTTAGRVEREGTLGTATSGNTDLTTILDQARNWIGRAASTALTNDTNNDILVLVGKDF